MTASFGCDTRPASATSHPVRASARLISLREGEGGLPSESIAARRLQWRSLKRSIPSGAKIRRYPPAPKCHLQPPGPSGPRRNLPRTCFHAICLENARGSRSFSFRPSFYAGVRPSAATAAQGRTSRLSGFLVDGRFREATQQSVGFFFSLQGFIEQADRVFKSELGAPGFEDAGARHLAVLDRPGGGEEGRVQGLAAAVFFRDFLALLEDAFDRFARLDLRPPSDDFKHLLQALDMLLRLIVVRQERLFPLR